MTIKEARQRCGLTQAEMSEKIGIPPRTLQAWEQGKRQPPEWAERLIIRELENIAKSRG